MPATARNPFEYRQLGLDEVEAVNRLLMGEYGDDYPHKLTVEKAKSCAVLWVAVHEGEIIGFARANNSVDHPTAWELCSLVVHKDFRGRGVAAQLTDLRLDQVRALNAALMFSEPVCYRTDAASQHNLVQHGFTLVGIEPAKYPDLKVDLLGSQPESVTLAVKSLRPKHEHRAINVPDEYAEVLATVLPVQDRIGVLMTSPMPGLVRHKVVRGSHSSGSEFVDVPANWPQSRSEVSRLRALGFGLSGIMPGYGETSDGHVFDYVRMWRPQPGVHVNFDLVHVTPALQRLREFQIAEHQDHAHT